MSQGFICPFTGAFFIICMFIGIYNGSQVSVYRGFAFNQLETGNITFMSKTHIGPCQEKTNNVVPEQIRHKPICVHAQKMARGWNFRI